MNGCVEYAGPGAGNVLNSLMGAGDNRRIDLASISSSVTCYVRVYITRPPAAELMVDGVYLNPGIPHTWWAHAGNPLLPGSNLMEGETLRIHSSAGPCTLRLDWESPL